MHPDSKTWFRLWHKVEWNVSSNTRSSFDLPTRAVLIHLDRMHKRRLSKQDCTKPERTTCCGPVSELRTLWFYCTIVAEYALPLQTLRPARCPSRFFCQAFVLRFIYWFPLWLYLLEFICPSYWDVLYTNIIYLCESCIIYDSQWEWNFLLICV